MFYLYIKRFFDIFFSLFGLIFLIPMSIIIKIIFLFNKDFDSIFYVQKRIGKNERVFKLYKFRTMIVDADKKLEELLKDPKIKEEYESSYKIIKDPRLTKIGKFLRKFSLDEFPQFINVFKGDMSLVGPRPVIKKELKLYKDSKEIIFSVRPGLTGNWVVNGRSNISYEDRINYELEYAKNISFLFDLKIIFKTIICVIKGDGAV